MGGDERVDRIIVGDALQVLKTLPSESIHCSVSSPPYYALRDYGVDGQIGLEPLHDCLGWTRGENCGGGCFICTMRIVYAEVRRVTRKDGTAWVNLGDSYAAGGGIGGTGKTSCFRNGKLNNQQERAPHVEGTKMKDLLLMPYRLALALQADGWYVRSAITWCKKSAMPESVQDRPTNATELIWLMSKGERYFYDVDAVREKYKESSLSRYETPFRAAGSDHPYALKHGAIRDGGTIQANPTGANLRNFWLLGPEPYAGAHFATFPTVIPSRAIKAGTSEHGCCGECGAPWVRVVERNAIGDNLGKRDDNPIAGIRGSGMSRPTTTEDVAASLASRKTTGWRSTCKHTAAPVIPCTVLDPFFGAGTTGLVARRLNRAFVGIELNPKYAKMAMKRIEYDGQLFNQTPIEMEMAS